jgi:hypothetical protein
MRPLGLLEDKLVMEAVNIAEMVEENGIAICYFLVIRERPLMEEEEDEEHVTWQSRFAKSSRTNFWIVTSC